MMKRLITLFFCLLPCPLWAVPAIVQCTQLQSASTTGLTSLATSISPAQTCLNADGVTTQACTAPVVNNYLVTMLNWVTVGNNSAYTGQTDNQSGNTYNIDVAENRSSDHIAYSYLVSGRVNAASGTYTITQSMTANGATAMDFQTCEVSGGIAVIDRVKGGEVNPGSSLTLTAPGQNAFANEIVFTTFLAGGFTGPITTGYTQTGTETTHVGSIYAYKIVSSLETSASTGNFSTSDNWLGVLGTYRQDCAGASKLVITTQPQNAALTFPLNVVTVAIQDSSGVTCTNSTNAITLSKDGSATWGTLASASSLTKNAVKGVATWTATDLSITTTTGSGSIDAAASGLTTAVSNSITIRATGCTGGSPNWTASTWNDLPTCHTNASNGDTITVGNGFYTVSSNTSITKYVKILAGSPGVTLLDNSCTAPCDPQNGTQNMLTITESSAGNIRFSGFVINQGTAAHSNPNGTIRVNQAASGLPVLVDRSSYASTGGTGDFLNWNSDQGVIFLNSMTAIPSGTSCSTQNAFVRHKLQGGQVWEVPMKWGAADTGGNYNLYIEGNTVVGAAQAVDVDDFARTVLRYNTFTNSAEIAHGVDTSGAAGDRGIDIYNNRFILDQAPQAGCSPATAPQNVNSFISQHNGASLVHANAIDDPTGNTYWGSKAAVSYFAEALRRIGPQYSCWATRTAPGFTYPVPHQIGWGYTTGMTTLTGGPFLNFQGGMSTVVQDSEPVYVWGNSGSGSPDAGLSIQDFPLGQNGPGITARSCDGQVLTFDTLVGGSGYSTGTLINTSGSPNGTGLTVNITSVSGGAVTGLTLNNTGISDGTGYAVNDVLTIAGGGGNATFRVASIEWNDSTLPKTSQVFVRNRDFFLAADAPNGQPGYSAAPCPHALAVATGLSGCNSASAGVTAYNSTPAPALSFTTQPVSVHTGGTMASFVLTSTDNTFTGNVTVALTSACGPTEGGTQTVAAIAGVATFSAVTQTGVSSGTCTITASATGYSNVISAPFYVGPNQLAFFVQPNSSYGTGNTISVTNAYQFGNGNIDSASTYSTTISIINCGASISGTTTQNASSGSAPWTLTVTSAVNVTGCNLSATNGTLTAVSNAFNVTGNTCVPAKLDFSFGQPSNALVGAPLGTVLVAVQDASGNRCFNDNSTVTIANTGGTCTGMTLGGTKSGGSTGAFITTNLTENAAGNCTLTATDGVLTPAVSTLFVISATPPPATLGKGGSRLHRLH